MKPPTSTSSGPDPGGLMPPGCEDRLSRKERELMRHRAELLDATERLLQTKLLHELTVQHIAAESEFSVGYIYKLFESKEDIIAALIKEKLRGLRKVIKDSAPDAGDWEERARALLETLSDWLSRASIYGSRVTPHLKDFARNHPDVAAEFASFLEFYRNFTDLIFTDAIRSKQLSEDEPGGAARSLRALITGFSEEALMHPGSPRTLARDVPLILQIMKRAFAHQGGDE